MKPFRDVELRQLLEKSKLKIKDYIDSYSNEEIMANTLDLLADNIYEEFYIPPVSIGNEDFSKRSIVQGKIQKRVESFFGNTEKDYVEVDGVIMTFFYPYVGEKDLFKCRASTFSLSVYPEISIQQGHFFVRYEMSLEEMKKEDAKTDVIKTLEHDLNRIRGGIEYANIDVKAFNDNLKSLAFKYLSDKKKKIECFFSVATMFEVPVTKCEYSETHVPMKRKIAPISHTYEKQKSYCITDVDYSDILETIKHTGSTYERTPSSYKSMHEEDLRNTLLATLNATYKGNATGESFRNHGKTDICIERENRAAFVAECKMWTGKTEVDKAVKQLDSYLTWRDCKTALIYFVKRKDFLKILITAEEALKSIPIMRQVQLVDKNEFKCCMVSEYNPGQIVQVRVMLFNMGC